REIARCRVDRERHDLLRRVVGDLLDVHAASLRGDEGDAAGAAVDESRKIELALDLRAILDVKPLDDAASRTGLDGDERVAQHLLSEGAHLVDRLGEANTALVTCGRLLELALAAPAGMALCLDYPHRARELLGRRDGFIYREGRVSGRCRDPILPEQLFGLVFVDVHRALPVMRKVRPPLDPLFYAGT